jgi:hypothetical protein
MLSDRPQHFVGQDTGRIMSVDQTTIAGIAAFITAGVLFLLHLRRVKAARVQARQRALAAVRAGRLPAVAAPPTMRLATQEIVHVCAKVAKGERTDARQDLGDGLLVVSSRRICFFGKRKASLTWKKIDFAGKGPDGDMVVRANDGRIYTFAFARGEDVGLIGEIMIVLDDIRARSAAKAAAAAEAKARAAAAAAPATPVDTTGQ